MTSEMEKDILKVLVSEEELKKRVQELGAQLHEKYQGHRPLFLGVLKGSFVFMADLVRACQVKSDVEFMPSARTRTPQCPAVGCRSPTIFSRTSPAGI